MANVDTREMYTVVFVVLFIANFFWYGRAGTFQVDKVLGWSVAVVLLIMAGRYTIAELKVRSPHLVAPGLSYSISGPEDILEKGEWDVVRLGGFRAFGVHKKGKQGTFITPQQARNTLGNNVAIKAQPKRIPNPDRLPVNIKKEIDDIELIKPVYIGYASRKQHEEGLSSEQQEKLSELEGLELEEANLDYLINTVENQNEHINLLQDMLSEKNSDIENEISSMKRRNQGGGSGGGIFDRVKNKVSGGGNGE